MEHDGFYSEIQSKHSHFTASQTQSHKADVEIENWKMESGNKSKIERGTSSDASGCRLAWRLHLCTVAIAELNRERR